MNINDATMGSCVRMEDGTLALVVYRQRSDPPIQESVALVYVDGPMGTTRINAPPATLTLIAKAGL